MPKIVLFGIVVLAMVACAKHDPILPGDRTAIFSAADVHVLNKKIEVLPDNAIDSGTYATVCDYRQDENNVVWQTGELGKVDLGGGGTVAKYIANLGVDVVDLGVPVLSMHAPFEFVSTFDVYMTYTAVMALFEN